MHQLPLRILDRKLAAETLGYRKRGSAKDAPIAPDAIQYFIDLTRETSNVRQPINSVQVADFSVLERARKELVRR